MPDEERTCKNCGNASANNPALAKIAPHPCDLCEPVAGKPCNWRPIPEPKRDAEADLHAVLVHKAYRHGEEADLRQGATANLSDLAEESLPHWIKRATAAEALLRKLVTCCDGVVGLIDDGEGCHEYLPGDDEPGGPFIGNAVNPEAEEVDELRAALEEAEVLLGEATPDAP
jgi:hypothetical protein